MQTGFTFGQQRPLSGGVSVQHGSFFSGDKTTVGVNQGRVELTRKFSLEPSYSYNRVDLPEGLFYDAPGTDPDDLYDDAVDVRQRAGAVQTRAAPR